ncbi:restriction endonuclease subunit S [Shewanella sp. 8A]|uniref:restriction endonuclease subunit S n=1 Tax=Shewanella sp. 8A TaxID=2943323 RepID=UPI00201B08ED|nr:restriction endonuclease subunit S [Shewanella sp. 8A]
MSELPKGWVGIKLGDVIELKYGKSLPAKQRSDSGFPVYGSNGVVGLHHEPLVLGGGLIVGRKGSFGEVHLSVQDFSPIDTTYYIDSFPTGTMKYWYYQLKNLPLTKLNRSTAIPGLNREDAYAQNILLPPDAEQKRIVAKLDEVLAQVDIIKAQLDRIPAILKRFRQSVLAAAVSGKLTEEWRGESDYIFHEEIQAEFPSSWNIKTIDDIGRVKGGKRLPKGEELVTNDTGHPYIRAGQLKEGTVIQGSEARNIQMYLEPHVQAQISRYTVLEGDAYITIVGASIGDAGIIPATHNGANLTENAAKICELHNDVFGPFVGLLLRSQFIQRLIKLEIKSGAQGKLALMRIKTLPFPKATFEEQKEIVRLVDHYFVFADTIEAQVKKAQARVDNLTQSILAKAFRGELVAQDPNDEPADKLLERIAQARTEAEVLAKTVKKAGRKVKATS